MFSSFSNRTELARHCGVISVCSFTTLNWKKIDNNVDRNNRETDTSSSMETGDMRILISQ
jgi:hypothetical protein